VYHNQVFSNTVGSPECWFAIVVPTSPLRILADSPSCKGIKRNEKIFDALEWLAAMCSHVPNKGEQMVRYCGYYSNVCRGQRKKANEDGLVPCILQPDESSKEYRKNWARFTRLWRT